MKRLSDAAIDILNELHRERLDYHSEYVPIADALNLLSSLEDVLGTDYKIEHIKELVKADNEKRAIILPHPLGKKLYRVTHPHRSEPKVTEFVVKGFRTIGKKKMIQLEVAVNGVPGTNYMYAKCFEESYEAAKKKLEE